MSAEAVRAVLLKAVRDDEFYERFRERPESALEDFDLTASERDSLIANDPSLASLLNPTVTGSEGDQAVTITITITGMHDWFNVASLRPAEELPRDVFKEATSLAERVLGESGADRMATLITLLQVLDGRQEVESAG